MYEQAAYFSESQKQFVQVADMPMPYAKNVLRKLCREDMDNFAGSALCQALMERLMPSKGVLTTLLRTKGEASYLTVPDDKKTVAKDKRMFTAIGKKLGVKVHVELNGDFLQASCEPTGEEVIVNVLHKKDPSKTFIGKGR